MYEGISERIIRYESIISRKKQRNNNHCQAPTSTINGVIVYGGFHTHTPHTRHTYTTHTRHTYTTHTPHMHATHTGVLEINLINEMIPPKYTLLGYYPGDNRKLSIQFRQHDDIVPCSSFFLRHDLCHVNLFYTISIKFQHDDTAP